MPWHFALLLQATICKLVFKVKKMQGNEISYCQPNITMKYCSSFPKSAHIGHSSEKKTLKINSDTWFICLLPQPRHRQGDVLTLKATAPAAAQHLYFHRVLHSSHPKDHLHHMKKAWAQSRRNRDKFRQNSGSDSLLNTRFCLFYRIIIIIIVVCLRRNLESYLAVCFANS